MPIAQLTSRSVEMLKDLDPQGWKQEVYMDNLQPWARIFTNSMLIRWPASEQHTYPVFWFEIKCVNKKPDHDGSGPYSIYIPLDREKIAAAPTLVNACLDHMQEQLPSILDEDVRHNLTESINIYRQQQGRSKRFEVDPRLVLDDSYLETAVGYVLLRKQLFA